MERARVRVTSLYLNRLLEKAPAQSGNDRSDSMAKKSKIASWKKPKKFKVREHNRCNNCGRPKAYIRHFGLCRICFRNMALTGLLPGVRKASW